MKKKFLMKKALIAFLLLVASACYGESTATTAYRIKYEKSFSAFVAYQHKLEPKMLNGSELSDEEKQKLAFLGYRQAQWRRLYENSIKKDEEDEGL